MQFRAPEEYTKSPQTEKVDVYSMGNILYVILFGEYPFERLKENEGQDSYRRHVVDSRKVQKELQRRLKGDDGKDHTARDIIVRAIEMCWKEDWRERASAKEVADFLVQSSGRHRSRYLRLFAQKEAGSVYSEAGPNSRLPETLSRVETAMNKNRG